MRQRMYKIFSQSILSYQVLHSCLVAGRMVYVIFQVHSMPCVSKWNLTAILCTSDTLNVIIYANHSTCYQGQLTGFSSRLEGSVAPYTMQESNLFPPYPDIPNQPPEYTNTNIGTPTKSLLLPDFRTEIHTTNTTQLPFYSSELGVLPIHPLQSSFHQSSGRHFDFSGPNDSLTDGNFDASPPPEVRQYFFLFEDSPGAMSDLPREYLRKLFHTILIQLVNHLSRVAKL
jgi:hypothetical protein